MTWNDEDERELHEMMGEAVTKAILVSGAVVLLTLVLYALETLI